MLRKTWRKEKKNPQDRKKAINKIAIVRFTLSVIRKNQP